jgi:hydroxymethylbilane synthase
LTARLATHPDVASRTRAVLERLVAAEVDVEAISPTEDGGVGFDALDGVRSGTLDLALVGIDALRGSAADDLTTVAVLPREEYRDVLVTLRGRHTALSELAVGSRIGVRGGRRMAFLKAHRPDLEAVPLPAGGGAVPSPWDAPGLDALILGAVEARQAGLASRIVEALDPKAWLPEPGQGALALVARHPIAEATAVDHLPTRTALRTELALLDALDADLDAPLGSLAQPSGRWIRLWAVAASMDGSRLVRSDLTGPLDEPEVLGAAVARQLAARGIDIVLASPRP